MAEPLQAGLLILQGNRIEQLAQTVFAWLTAHPLAPLEQETVLVQSNGMAEWFKMELAAAQGICASTRVELPARFIWRAYRAVLGRGTLPALAPLDKLPLTWRLMQGLPHLAALPGFEPVNGFLAGGDASRRLQLAQRLADLFDQYQVYRSDWLDDWQHGRDVLQTGERVGTRSARPVHDDQRWQPALWRELLATLSDEQRDLSRADTHRRFLQALRQPSPDGAARFTGLPRRIVLFGISHLPLQTLDAIAALSAHCQVLMAVPNPCRFFWADIIDGRDLLRFEQRRQPLRHNRNLAAVSLQDMHVHSHPLLAAWGRQSRDFIRQLDAFDDAASARQHFALPRVDLFDEQPGVTLLEQVQAAIRDLCPLADHARAPVPEQDRSIVFHIAHSAQREVEILHDQLLHLLAYPPGGQPLQPRDIVVMMPQIEPFAPAIRSVFGQYARTDARYIPWGIADERQRGRLPMLVALEALLRLPQERMQASQLRDLLDVPAVARCFGLSPEDQPVLAQWLSGAGARWGLNDAHRASLGMGAAGDQNTLAFGLRRMLLGYATGELPDAAGFDGIEPYPEVAGLSAAAAGALAELLHRLTRWWGQATTPRTPQAWADQVRALLRDFFSPVDDAEQALLAALDEAIANWLQACEAAGFDEAVALPVVREAVLDAVDEPGASRRFRAGGVTFCTLLPLRAIPFEVVCLLGMNDGDYPRRSSRNDFDLMAQPGLARPGDRSRRDDDRQLMLDALLSARRVLYLSWAGRSPQDNREQPPSTLVAQLRDYLGQGWGADVVAGRTTEHPLQPFSRRYFEGQGLVTYASEWRVAHEDPSPSRSPDQAGATAQAPREPQPRALTVQGLAAFVRNPVREFFRHRLQVSFDELDVADEDEECFAVEGLERWGLVDDVLQHLRGDLSGVAGPQVAGLDDAGLGALLAQQIARARRAGRLPIAALGQHAEAVLLQALMPLALAWRRALQTYPVRLDKMPLRFTHSDFSHPDAPLLALDDWLVGLRATSAGARLVWLELHSSKVASRSKKKKDFELRPDKLVSAWVRCLASAASGQPADGILMGEGALVTVTAPPQADAQRQLADLLLACREGLDGDRPLPTALLTGLQWLADPHKAAQTYEGSFGSRKPGEGSDACLARLYPNFDRLRDDPGFEPTTERLYEPYREWLKDHAHVVPLNAGNDTGDAADE